jgi:hypothetical protein
MILDKAKMAHDWYMKHSESPSFMDTEIKMAWQYADAMQAEADKRAVKLPDVFFDTKPSDGEKQP